MFNKYPFYFAGHTPHVVCDIHVVDNKGVIIFGGEGHHITCQHDGK